MLTGEFADFDAHEYERRLAKLRDLMSRNRMDAVLITTDTNHRYFSGHWTHRWGHKFTSLFALLPLERDPVLIVRHWKQECVRRTPGSNTCARINRPSA